MGSIMSMIATHLHIQPYLDFTDSVVLSSSVLVTCYGITGPSLGFSYSCKLLTDICYYITW